MTLNQIILNRLSFIQYLYQDAVEKSRKPSPQDSASILAFHDAIELFLQLSVEFLNANPKTNIKFMAYWDIINQKLIGQQLSQKASMNRLNTARRSLKHNGILPTKSDIEAFRVNSKNFFEDNSPIVFGIDFSEISLIDLIHNDKVKRILKQAQELCKNGQYKDSLEQLVIAFRMLILDYEKDKKDYYGRPLFQIGEDLSSAKFWDSSDDGVIDSLSEIQMIIKLLCLKIDCRKYIKFRVLTPIIFSGHELFDEFKPYWPNAKERKFNKEQVEFCFNFIIESALKLQEFDFEIENL